MGGQIIGHAGLDAVPEIGPHEKALVEECLPEFCTAIGRGTLRMEVVKVDVPEFGRPFAQGFDEDVRHAGNAGEMDVVSALDGAYGLPGRYEGKLLLHSC